MVMILYLISCICFWPTEGWMFLYMQCIEKQDYKAVIPEMPVLMPSLRDTLHKSRRISMWCLLKAIVLGFDHWICCMLHACWAYMASGRLVSMSEDVRKTKKLYKIFLLSPLSIWVSVMYHTTWMHTRSNKQIATHSKTGAGYQQ